MNCVLFWNVNDMDIKWTVCGQLEVGILAYIPLCQLKVSGNIKCTKSTLKIQKVHLINKNTYCKFNINILKKFWLLLVIWFRSASGWERIILSGLLFISTPLLTYFQKALDTNMSITLFMSTNVCLLFLHVFDTLGFWFPYSSCTLASVRKTFLKNFKHGLPSTPSINVWWIHYNHHLTITFQFWL